jgi:hypothetical protein
MRGRFRVLNLFPREIQAPVNGEGECLELELIVVAAASALNHNQHADYSVRAHIGLRSRWEGETLGQLHMAAELGYCVHKLGQDGSGYRRLGAECSGI